VQGAQRLPGRTSTIDPFVIEPVILRGACGSFVERTGSPLSAKPMLCYFEPLVGWLKEQNKGRACTLSPID
jgi:hypothetical protein